MVAGPPSSRMTALRLSLILLPSSARTFTRVLLDRLGSGVNLEVMPWGNKKVKLPRSRLANKDAPPTGTGANHADRTNQP